MRERLADREIGRCWILRLPASAGFWQQLRHAHVPRRVGAMVGVFAQETDEVARHNAAYVFEQMRDYAERFGYG